METRNLQTTFGALSTIMKVIVVVAIVLVLIFIGYIAYSVVNDFSVALNQEPYLVKGTKLGRTPLIIPASQVTPSMDGKYGFEFSYAMWIYINDWSNRSGEYKHILHKGNHTGQPLQAPGIWSYPNENKLAINMNTFHSVKESCDIGNIPIDKWVHLVISVIGKHIDVYVNGNLKKRCEFKGVPKQNFGDVFINQFGGFDGFLSNVRYFNYAIPYYRIEQLLNQGPSQESCVDDDKVKPPYLAPDWWQTNGFPVSGV